MDSEDSEELRIAMASAAGLAAGWLMSSERAGPSEQNSHFFLKARVVINVCVFQELSQTLT